MHSLRRPHQAATKILLLAAHLVLTHLVSLGQGAEPPNSVALTARRAIRLSFVSMAGEQYQLYRSNDGIAWEKDGDVILGTGDEITLVRLTDEDTRGLFRVETVAGDPVEVVKNLEDFKAYAGWKLVQTLLGPDPALGEAHGGGAVFRSIYVSPADAKPVNGQLPQGTILLKELRENVDGEPGAVTGALTVMVKRGGSFNPEGNGWDWIMADISLNETLLRGGNETFCHGCHVATQDTDFAFSAAKLDQ